MSAMMLLTANSMQNPQHDKLSLDNRLVEAGLQTIDKIVEETQSNVVRSFRDTFTKLDQDARRRRIEATAIANNAHLSTLFVSP
jgi:hypothetical protein